MPAIVTFRCALWIGRHNPVSNLNNELTDLKKLIQQLDADRSWLLQKIDGGSWPELRLDLAALERELSKLLLQIGERQDE